MKLKSVDQPKIFYQVAHRLIILQKEPFSLQDILKQYYAKCGSNINLDYAKKVVLEELDKLLNQGIVTKNKNGTPAYSTIFIEDKSNQEKLKTELEKDESWIILY